MYVLSVCEVGTAFYFWLKYGTPMGIQDNYRERMSLKRRNSGGPVEDVTAHSVRQIVQATRDLRYRQDQRPINNPSVVQIEVTP